MSARASGLSTRIQASSVATSPFAVQAQPLKFCSAWKRRNPRRRRHAPARVAHARSELRACTSMRSTSKSGIASSCVSSHHASEDLVLGPFYINLEHVERGVAAARHERAERRRVVPRGERCEPAAVARSLEPEADLLEA